MRRMTGWLSCFSFEFRFCLFTGSFGYIFRCFNTSVACYYTDKETYCKCPKRFEGRGGGIHANSLTEDFANTVENYAAHCKQCDSLFLVWCEIVRDFIKHGVSFGGLVGVKIGRPVSLGFGDAFSVNLCGIFTALILPVLESIYKSKCKTSNDDNFFCVHKNSLGVV